MKLSKLLLLVVLSGTLIGCHDVLDKTDLSAVSEEDTWNDENLATAYINEIYDDNLPGWGEGWQSDISDESDHGESYMYGQLTENDVDYWPYSSIRNINVLLANIDDGSLDESLKNRLKGEALFFRAFQYFEMARRYGGVPLILEPQSLEENLLVERAPTADVFDQIVSDLDTAIEYLPAMTPGSGENTGRVHKGTAMALKGRVLLFWASPQFDPQQNSGDRWQAAYDANKQAKEHLEAQGFGLYEDFENIWFDEMNKEAIFVHRYEYPVHTNEWDAATRPLDESQGSAGANEPVLEMINAFPMKDGKAIDDPSSDYTYDPDFFWQNRDPRFKQTIAYNGSLWELSGKSGRIQWTFVGAEENAPTETGYYTRKAVNESFDAHFADESATDWIEIRFAEVLLNFAEAANEVGQQQEAYDALTRIRERAEIDPGTNSLYGLNPTMTADEMRDAILLERKIELAFEGKRYWDLRRHRLFEPLLNGTRRHGHMIERIASDQKWDSLQALSSQEIIDELNQNYPDYFEHNVIERDNQFVIDWQDEYYFYAIPQEHLQLNSNLEQTEGWPGGTFEVPGSQN